MRGATDTLNISFYYCACMDKISKIVIPFKKLAQRIQRNLDKTPSKKDLADFELPCTLFMNCFSSNSNFKIELFCLAK